MTHPLLFFVIGFIIVAIYGLFLESFLPIFFDSYYLTFLCNCISCNCIAYLLELDFPPRIHLRKCQASPISSASPSSRGHAQSWSPRANYVCWALWAQSSDEGRYTNNNLGTDEEIYLRSRLDISELTSQISRRIPADLGGSCPRSQAYIKKQGRLGRKTFSSIFTLILLHL